ncbi:MAG: hypothetical protein FWF01_02815 [Alphaproteobacteria bacterium]|nr:hypothetical protein [Alphaproteobacteria bacterium]
MITNEQRQHAKDLKSQFKIKEALDAFLELSKLDPNDMESFAEAGFCYILLGDIESALKSLTRADELAGGKDDIVTIYKQTMEIACGKEAAQPLKADPEDFMVTAQMLGSVQKYDQALRLIEYIAIHFPKNPWLDVPMNYLRVIMLLCQSGAVDIAEHMLQTMTEKIPQSWETFAATGAIKAGKGDIKDAKTDFNKALELGGAQSPEFLAYISQREIFAQI